MTRSAAHPFTRRMPVGAEVVPGAGVHFRVWAPGRRQVSVVVDGRGDVPLAADETGHFAGLIDGLMHGARYAFRLDGGDRTFPDPASRAQPDGPHGPSAVVDPDRFAWTDTAWRGLRPSGQVLYELHVGTFTVAGTWDGAAQELPCLRDLGVTAVELLPVAEFPGRFGWGYDGVDLFAPTRLYGGPDDMRRFVDRAHALGLGVILDVVYNHLGPDGNYLREFSPAYFSTKYSGEWGDPFNFDEEGKEGARALVVENAAYWIREFHVDGLRVDATQGMQDASPVHVLRELTARARREAGTKGVLLVAENEPQDTTLLRPIDEGGAAFDLVWNDDLHHTARVALTGKIEAYYSDYGGSPQEIVSAAKRGYLYQGQRSEWQGKPRGGTTRGFTPQRFVAYLQNHDQIANSASGLRLHRIASPARLRAMTAVLLTSPWTPMLFMGQERCADQPFLYFADHKPELAHLVRAGRGGFLAQFPSLSAKETREQLADPSDTATFARCKLHPAGPGAERCALHLHRDLLELRRTEEALRSQGAHGFDGAVLGPDALCLRFFGATDRDDRLLLVNLGRALRLGPAPEPLLAPPGALVWRLLWSSDDKRYGGDGTAPVEPETQGFRLPGEAALLLRPQVPTDAAAGAK